MDTAAAVRRRIASTTSRRNSRRATCGRDDVALREAVAREGGGAFADALGGLRRARRRRALPPRLRRPPRPAAPAHARPLRPAHRPGRVPSQLPPADAGGDRARRRRAVVVAAAARRARRARGAELPAPPGRTRHQLPADDDPRRGAGVAPRTGAGANGPTRRPRRHYDPRDVRSPTSAASRSAWA